MGVAFVHIRFHVVVPFERWVGIERVAGTDADVVEEGVFTHQLDHLTEVFLGALSVIGVVWLVHRGYRLDGHTLLLAGDGGRLDHVVPVLRLAVIVLCQFVGVVRVAVEQN